MTDEITTNEMDTAISLTNEDGVPVLRVRSRTNVKSLAGAITATIKESPHYVELRAIGDGAIGRAIRASIIAKGYLATAGISLVLDPSYFETMIDGNERTGVKMLCGNR